MKVFISVDMEGIVGVNTSKQCSAHYDDYKRMRKLMTQQVNAAIKGAKEAGAKEFLVNDAHGSMTNLLIEELEASARLISGTNKHLCQMEGIDETFAGAFFIGYHAGDGINDGTINHTLLGSTVFKITCNGEEVDEAAINAGIAGFYGVPVALVAGDNVVCTEAQRRLGKVFTAEVKKAIDRFTVNSLGVDSANRVIHDAAKLAVKNLDNIKPFSIKGPVTFEVTFKSTSPAYMCLLFPQVKRLDTKTIRFTADDYLSAFKLLWGLLLFAYSVQSGLA